MTDGPSCRPKHFLEYEEVLDLLRSEIARAGGQVHWANMMGVDRSNLNKALHGTTVVAISGPALAGIFSLPEFLMQGASVDAAALAAAQQAVTPEDVCYILYTSGSTAAPKGVTLAHGPLLANGFDIGERQHLTAADRLWLAVPNSRALPEDHEVLWRNIAAGAPRGGIGQTGVAVG